MTDQEEATAEAERRETIILEELDNFRQEKQGIRSYYLLRLPCIYFYKLDLFFCHNYLYFHRTVCVAGCLLSAKMQAGI